MPPGGKVAISLIGALVGQSGLALAAGVTKGEPSVATEAARTVRRVSFMRRSCSCAPVAARHVPKCSNGYASRVISAFDLT